MAGHKAGENIISPPNSHIGKEFNCCDLFIGGREGDAVLCPIDGTITSVGIDYHPTLTSSIGYHTDPRQSWDENLRQIKPSDNISLQYLSGYVTLRIADGRHVSISGLLGDYRFREGQKIAAGDTLGRLAWSYRGIPKPSLLVSVSLPSTVSDDPLSPFGLESRFHLNIAEREDPVSVEKMREDLTVLEQAVLELYPSLNDRMSDKAFHDTMEALRQSVTKPLPRLMLEPLFRFRSLLHDSHLDLLPDKFDIKMADLYSPVLFYLWCDDTLRVLMTSKGYEKYEKYLGRVVQSIDGMPARDYARQTHQYIGLYDLDVKSHLEEENVLLSSRSTLISANATANSKSHVVFADGEEIDVPFGKIPVVFHSTGTPAGKIRQWRCLNWMETPDSTYAIRQLNDSTAYLSIRTFDIGDMQLEKILDWIGQCTSANMIIDLRNNAGGEPEVMNRLLACFAQQPLNRQRGGHLFVKKQGPFESLRYSENHTKDEVLFSDYIQQEGKPGYYCFDTTKASICIMPDSNHQYTGRVYVLTNGNSMSCATIFPSVLVRNRRGVSVGRETGSAYHYITAMEMALICLPNTQRTIEIPMVKVVFDTTVCARTPWGRGLLPDYELPLTYNEITMGADGETDVMLEYALQLIADGKYLSSEDPFAEVDAPQEKGRLWLWVVVTLGVIASGGLLVRRRIDTLHSRLS